MPDALIQRAPSAYTGPNAASLPTLYIPPNTATLPVTSGLTRRFVASELGNLLVPGESVTEWAESPVGGNATSLTTAGSAATSATAPTFALDTSLTVPVGAVKFGVDTDSLGQVYSLARAHALVIVARIFEAATQTANATVLSGSSLTTGSRANLFYNPTGGSANKLTFNGASSATAVNVYDTLPHLYAVNFDANGGVSTLNTDTTQVTSPTVSDTQARTRLSVGNCEGNSSGSSAHMYVYEVLTFNRRLSGTDLTNLTTAMKATYGF
jgi:hypothetical protein